jgi:pimeloyl-ACP methyl ester carboxylesterase
MVETFQIAASDAVLADLRHRLESVRWADDFANDDWRYGANANYLKQLVEYWLHGYDWRRTEARINGFSHFRTQLGEIPIHFIHQRGKGPAPVPLILSHGWPWTFWDFQKLIGPLSDPAAHGGDPADAFDVVVPSLPGYGFSSPLRTPGINCWRTADLWVEPMARLGYERFAAQGGDWGAMVSAQLGHKYADRVIGVHFQLMTPLDVFSGGSVDPAFFEPDEQDLLRRNQAFMQNEAGYMVLQSTKPETPAFALNDSPVGLLAWIVEKRRRWSDCGGDVERRFSKDDLLDTVMIYWVTQTYGTSARYYYEAAHNLWTPSHDRSPVVEAPTGIAWFPGEVMLQPKKWAEHYYNLQRWTVMPSGGHFGPMEEPVRLIEDVRGFFRDLRPKGAV